MADLSGEQEVPTAGSPAVGDPDGSAQALVRVQGDRVTFALKWQGIDAPTLGHVHQGTAGVNGDVKIPLFTTAMPVTLNAAAGQVTLRDQKLARQLKEDPSGFYVNLHSQKFPGGAVRGQLKKAEGLINPLSVIGSSPFQALADGGQEVPKDDKSKVGDADGRAITFLQPKNTTVGFAMAWMNIAAPTLGHIHAGSFGKNGDVAFPLFATPIPSGVFAVSGTLPGQDEAVVEKVRRSPEEFYVNMHTAEFPDGAVRGQLFGESAVVEPEATGAPGRITLFDEAGSFSREGASQGVAGAGCVDVLRTEVASAVQTEKPVKVWSGKGCTGTSLVIEEDVADLSTVDFDNRISSVFFG
ncbi:CHRD domain-containing protein [Streptomyces massasporeus]|uniref:CHRD domain-containing protein n=1 Tax=Streptomyces massasporeus TaxID=67324 RepID=UPI0037AFE617